MKTLTKKQKHFYIWAFLIGALGLTVILRRVIAFKTPNFDYQHLIKSYGGLSLINRWAELCYFTYWSLILSSIWAMAFGLAHLFDLKVKKVTTNKTLTTCVATYQIVTCLIYTVFELSGKAKFVWYGNSFESWLNLIENITVHYLIVFFHLFALSKIKQQPLKFSAKNVIKMLSIPIVYFILISFVCGFVLPVKWYPYPIFTQKLSWLWLFGDLQNYNPTLAFIYWVLALAFVAMTFITVFYVVIKVITRSSKNTEIAKA